MKSRLPVLAAILLLAAALAAIPPVPTRAHWEAWCDYHTRADSAHGFDVQSYDVALTIDDANEWIQGTVTTVVTAEQTLTSITYELEQLTVTAVRVNGATAAYTYDGHEIVITLPNIPAGQNFTTEVDYEGNPTLSDDVYSLGMFFMGSYLFTLSDPSGVRWWMPAYDHPWDKSTVHFAITVRDDWTVACNGLRTGTIDNGNGTATTSWQCDDPIVPHLFVIHAGAFVEYDQQYGDIPIQNFIPQSYYNAAVEDFSNLPSMMETYSNLFGAYPFQKYGNVVVNMQTFGAMEHQTMTTMGNSYINGNHSGETIIAHELSHQWFGDCVTPLTWADVWLSEGFATYSEALYTEAWLGWETAVFYIENYISGYYLSWAGNTAHTIYDPEFNEYFNPPQYEKAGSVLHMLRLEVGDDTFFVILQTWFATYHNGWGVTSEFIDVVNQVTGENYDGFFQQWIYHSGTPTVNYAFFFNQGDPGSFRCSAVTQSNGNGSFELHVPIVFENAAGAQDSVLVYAGPEATAPEYEAPCDDWTGYTIDPNNWILARSHETYLPELVGAYAADGSVMLLWLPFWEDLALLYNVYRSDSPTGPFTCLSAEPVDDTAYTDESAINGQTYYYAIAAVLDDVWETELSPTVQATPIAFPLDRGVLVIDETLDGTGATPINPTDAMVDEFYDQVLDCTYHEWDYASLGAPSLDTLACYSTVLWIDDDVSQHRIENNLQALGNYVLGGGNLVVSGWKTAQEVPNDFLTVFLSADETLMWTQPWCTGAASASYPALIVDEAKTLSAWNGQLAYVCTFPDVENGLYTFQGDGDPVGQTCALKSQPNGTFVLLGFPLYYMHADGVKSLLSALLTEFGEDMAVTPEPVKEMTLALWPNPVHPGAQSLSVQFDLPVSGLVKAAVYNIRGQRVATLTNEVLPGGRHTLAWNGTDDHHRQVAGGVYLLRVEQGDNRQTRKVLLLR